MRQHKMIHSENVSINNNEFRRLLNYNLSQIMYDCEHGFQHCRICEQDYSVQWADTAVKQLYKDKIITKKAYNKILNKLYSGHRG